jgi:hypothetical protein
VPPFARLVKRAGHGADGLVYRADTPTGDVLAIDQKLEKKLAARFGSSQNAIVDHELGVLLTISNVDRQKQEVEVYQ